MLLWRILRARWHIVAAIGCGLAAFALLPATVLPLTRSILAWDIGCLVFLATIAAMFANPDEARMAHRAARQQEGEWVVFWVTLAGLAASMAGIIVGFGSGLPADLRVPLVAATLVLSWLTTHTLFALRYAHAFYSRSPGAKAPDGGLIFPGGQAPDYWDFVYFALVIGMTFQVSDVQITSRTLRRLALAQGVLGFIFNTVIVALSVNLAAGLLIPASTAVTP